MLKEIAGENAGLIWNTLNENGEMQLKQLKKKTKLKDKFLKKANKKPKNYRKSLPQNQWQQHFETEPLLSAEIYLHHNHSMPY